MQRNKLPFCTQTITVYNTYWKKDDYGKLNQVWQGTVIPNAMFKHAYKAKQHDAVTLPSGSYTAKAPDDTAYVSPQVWATLAERTGRFTVQSGDVIALHDIALELPSGSSPTAVLVKQNIAFFTAKTAQANLVGEMPATSHFCWTGGSRESYSG